MSDRPLSEQQLGRDPISMFDSWFSAATKAGEPEPEAMALATVDEAGLPAVRFVLLKHWDAQGFVFYTNGLSPKGRAMRANPEAAFALRWKTMDRQVRVAGAVRPVEPSISDAYFSSRERRSQLGAWASSQSEVIDDRGVLDQRLAEAEERFAGIDVPRPDYWGGWRISPRSIEFWQGRSNRLHDRFRFERDGDDWAVNRLSP